MNIGISDLSLHKKTAGALALAVLFLGACTGTESAQFGFAPAGKSAGQATQTGPAVPKTSQTKLANGSVNLKAPKGYCIDRSSVRDNGLTGSSAMLAACSSLDGKGAQEAAVMTVSVSPRNSADTDAPTADDLARALAPAAILEKLQRGSLALVQVGSGGDKIFAPADPVYWRGATLLDTRLVMLAVYAPKGSPMAGRTGADLLTKLARGLSATRANFLGLETPATDASATETPEGEKKDLGQVIGGLFKRS